MARAKLSAADMEYIDNHHKDMTVEQLCAGMPGIGPKTVEKYIEENILPKAKAEQSFEDRQEQVRKRSGLTSGKLMARDPNRGFVAMTEGASEMGDSHRERNSGRAVTPDRVFVMDPARKIN